MLRTLCFWIGGGADEAHVPARLALEWAHEYFDPAASERHDLDRLVYLARHGRIDPSYFEAMTDREVDRWVERVSEMIKRENPQRAK